MDCSKDLKQNAVLDENDVKLSVILNHISRVTNIDDSWMELLKYNNDDSISEISNIKNWLRYKIATKLKLYTDKDFDCDTTKEAIDFCKILLTDNLNTQEYKILDLNEYKQYIKYNKIKDKKVPLNKRYIYIINTKTNEKIILETDTMNSMQKIFGMFMRKIFIAKYNNNKWLQDTYREYYKLSYFDYKSNGKIYRDIYILNNLDTFIENIKNEEELNCIKEFNKFAKLTHTLANITLVPLGYNTSRGINSKIRDYWDLTILDLQKMDKNNKYQNKNFEWYIKNIDIFINHNWFDSIDPTFDKRTVKKLAPDDRLKRTMSNTEILQYITNINKLIEKS